MNLPGDPYLGHGASWAPDEEGGDECDHSFGSCRECGAALAERHAEPICDNCAGDIDDDTERERVIRLNEVDGLLPTEKRMLRAGGVRLGRGMWSVNGSGPMSYATARDMLI